MKKLTHSPFFRVSCGCIGLQIGTAEWQIIKACDAEYFEPSLSIRGTRTYDDNKSYTPLSNEETKALLGNIEHLVSFGHQHIDMAHSLERAKEFKFLQ